MWSGWEAWRQRVSQEHESTCVGGVVGGTCIYGKAARARREQGERIA